MVFKEKKKYIVNQTYFEVDWQETPMELRRVRRQKSAT